MDTKEITQRFGMFIRDGRVKKSLLQKEVAAKLNISQVYYSYIENGSRNVDLPLALEICRVLELDLNDFTSSLLQ
jgi:transcriptional regulator with XRE-family HTH domain